MQIFQSYQRLIAQFIAISLALFLVYHYKEHYNKMPAKGELQNVLPAEEKLECILSHRFMSFETKEADAVSCEEEESDSVEEKAHECEFRKFLWRHMIERCNVKSVTIKTNDEISISIDIIDATGSVHDHLFGPKMSKQSFKSVTRKLLKPAFACIDEDESSITFEESKLHFFKKDQESADAMVFSRCQHGDTFLSLYEYKRERGIWKWKHQNTIQTKTVRSFQALETHVEGEGKWEKWGKQKVFIKKRKWTGPSGDEETRSRQKLQGLIQRKEEEGAEGKCKLMIENDD